MLLFFERHYKSLKVKSTWMLEICDSIPVKSIFLTDQFSLACDVFCMNLLFLPYVKSPWLKG